MNASATPYGVIWEGAFGGVSDARRLLRQPIIQPGLSIGGMDRGTAGLVVQDAQRQPYLLTCYHVLQWPLTVPPRPVTQPGAGLDGGRFGVDTVAYGSRFLFPSTGYDAALAWFDRRLRAFDPQQFGTTTVVRSTIQPVVGQRLIKSGRTTGITHGVVESFGFFPVGYERGLGTHLIRGFRIVADDPNDLTPISAPGDSGAVWYDPATGAGVGLLVAGGLTPLPYSIACSLPDVLFKLGVSPWF